MKTTIGVIGAGKRFLNVYFPLLKKLENHFEISGFFTRTESKGEAIEADLGLKYFKSIQSLLRDCTVDVLLLCVNENVSFEILKTLESIGNKTPVLIETPVSSIEIVRLCNTLSFDVSVSEQWPYLPVEQFKETILSSGIINRPFLVQNDCRSFDYHAIAQLRSYLSRDIQPKLAMGQNIVFQSPEFLNNKGEKDQSLESWDISSVKFNNGAVLIHNFSYLCKTAPYRSLQSLRLYSTNGSILTGKINDKDNDYEILDFKFLDGLDTKNLSPNIERDSNGNVRAISSSIDSVYWENPYEESLNDQESAIAHIFTAAAKIKGLYSVKDSFIDNLIVSGVKQSAMREGTISFPQL